MSKARKSHAWYGDTMWSQMWAHPSWLVQTILNKEWARFRHMIVMCGSERCVVRQVHGSSRRVLSGQVSCAKLGHTVSV